MDDNMNDFQEFLTNSENTKDLSTLRIAKRWLKLFYLIYHKVFIYVCFSIIQGSALLFFILKSDLIHYPAKLLNSICFGILVTVAVVEIGLRYYPERKQEMKNIRMWVREIDMLIKKIIQQEKAKK